MNNKRYKRLANKIMSYIEEKDYNELQDLLDRILSRSPKQNISYEAQYLIEIDI